MNCCVAAVSAATKLRSCRRLARALTEPFPTRDPAKSAKLMAALDAVNARFGRGALRPLATGIARPWGTRHGRLSPRYTTRVEEIMEARAW